MSSPFQPKIFPPSPSFNLEKPAAAEGQAQEVVVDSSIPCTHSSFEYPSASDNPEDSLQLFNQSFHHKKDRQESHLTNVSDITFPKLASMPDADEKSTASNPKPITPTQGDEEDLIATIIKLKVQLAQAQSKNDQLSLMLRQCLSEKMDLECEMRASGINNKFNNNKQMNSYDVTRNRPDSFHTAPMLPQEQEAVRTKEFVHDNHESVVWREETISTHYTNKLSYVQQLMQQKLRDDGGVRIVKHR